MRGGSNNKNSSNEKSSAAGNNGSPCEYIYLCFSLINLSRHANEYGGNAE